eukprot:2740141-Pleurochrysis_carterae.AAC.1
MCYLYAMRDVAGGARGRECDAGACCGGGECVGFRNVETYAALCARVPRCRDGHNVASAACFTAHKAGRKARLVNSLLGACGNVNVR